MKGLRLLLLAFISPTVREKLSFFQPETFPKEKVLCYGPQFSSKEFSQKLLNGEKIFCTSRYNRRTDCYQLVGKSLEPSLLAIESELKEIIVDLDKIQDVHKVDQRVELWDKNIFVEDDLAEIAQLRKIFRVCELEEEERGRDMKLGQYSTQEDQRLRAIQRYYEEQKYTPEQIKAENSNEMKFSTHSSDSFQRFLLTTSWEYDQSIIYQWDDEKGCVILIKRKQIQPKLSTPIFNNLHK